MNAVGGESAEAINNSLLPRIAVISWRPCLKHRAHIPITSLQSCAKKYPGRRNDQRTHRHRTIGRTGELVHSRLDPDVASLRDQAIDNAVAAQGPQGRGPI